MITKERLALIDDAFVCWTQDRNGNENAIRENAKLGSCSDSARRNLIFKLVVSAPEQDDELRFVLIKEAFDMLISAAIKHIPQFWQTARAAAEIDKDIMSQALLDINDAIRG